MNVLLRSIAISSAAALALTASPTVPARAQSRGRPAPEGQSGLAVGEKAPRFTLKDQEGKERSLDELLQKGKVALVFYRSVDW
jgi:cytochrome oxidase Cu insertion factor (SCO1/SenC/PrrC family)